MGIFSIGSVVFTILVLMWIFGDSDYDVDGGLLYVL